MKKIKNFLPLLLIFAIILSSVSGFANPTVTSFPDVPTTHWAHDNIISMANQGMIRGFTDGTFGPELPVTHLQSLILLSRVLGVEDPINEQLAERHLELYADVLAPFNTDFALEVAFLIYNDILSVEELEMYISNQPLPRYRAAILLTKLMGGEEEVLNAPMVISSFRDAALFPPGTRGFGEFVLTNGLMQGTAVDEETNAPIFTPQGQVTRAQMATMLVNLLPSPLDRVSIMGTITNVNIVSRQITVSTAPSVSHVIPLMDNSVIYVDGERTNLSTGLSGNYVLLTYINDIPRIIDTYTTTPVWWEDNEDDNGDNGNDNGETTRIYGILFNIEHSAGVVQVVLQDIDNSATSARTRHPLSPDATFTINGLQTILQDLRNNDLAYLTINDDGIVIEINTYSRHLTINGTLSRIVNMNSIEVRLANGDLVIYPIVQNQTIAVTRNGQGAILADVMVGDSITLRLEYNRIIRVDANSVNLQQTGIIEEIRITANPTIVIRVNDELHTFHLSDNIEVTLDGNDATWRDLNVGSQVRFRAESETIVSIESTATASLDFVEGIVEAVDEQFRFIRVAVTNPVTQIVSSQEILVLNNANITQVGVPQLRQMSHIRVGQRIFAHGTNVTGTFRANTITIVSD